MAGIGQDASDQASYLPLIVDDQDFHRRLYSSDREVRQRSRASPSFIRRDSPLRMIVAQIAGRYPGGYPGKRG
jgi:hypothetical protein